MAEHCEECLSLPPEDRPCPSCIRRAKVRVLRPTEGEIVGGLWGIAARLTARLRKKPTRS